MSGTNPPARTRPRMGVIIGVVASLAVLVTSAAGYATVDNLISKVQTLDNVIDPGSGDGPAVGTDAINILVLGSDNRDGLSRAEQSKLTLGHADYGQHSDTIMIIHIGSDTSHVTALSLPRDTLVTIPDYTDPNGKNHPAHQAKINAAFGAAGGGAAGARLVTRTVQDLTGIKINHYVEVNFQGFLNMVDALEGVPVCLTKPLKDKASGLDLPAGKQTISGPQALAYVRVRHIDPTQDLGRIQRQQTFISSMIQKAMSGDTIRNPQKLSGFLGAALSSLKVDSGLDRNTMFDLANRLSGINIKNINFITAPVKNADYRGVPGLGSTVQLSPNLSKTIFAEIANDEPVVAPVTATTVAVAPTKISVKVFNAGGVKGMGAKAATDLRTAGFAVPTAAATAPNAAPSPATATVVKYDPRFDTSMLTLKAALPDAQFVPTKGLGRVFQVYVGSSYSGLTTFTVAKKVNSHLNARSAADNICG